MKVVILLTLLVALTTCERWAVLVAGSNTYSNYRHQADVFHSYQSLINNGFDPERIIVMAYDDIANSASNPFKGKVYNKPSYNSPGVDVYAGVKIDYSKADVTPQNFINVLLGDR
jgi:legumain